MGKWAIYEQRKHAWVMAHPDATPQEYEETMRAIAKALGL